MMDIWAVGLLGLIGLVYLAVGSVLRELNAKIERIEASIDDTTQ
ncbi:hypothetical protein [Halocatena marina]|nr:hypothetical protein [Halocatena marina]